MDIPTDQLRRQVCRRRFNLPTPLVHRANFPTIWSRYCRSMFLSSEEIALFHGVRDKTAQRWLDGDNRPTGDVVDYAWRYAPDAMRAAIDE